MDKSKETDIVLEPATHEDVEKTVEAAYKEGWEHVSVHRARAHYVYDPEGWIVAKDKLTNRTIGYTGASKFPAVSAASVGYVIVEPEYRGRGIGSNLVDKWLEYLHDMNSVTLYGTKHGYPIYLRRGFVDISRHLTEYTMDATEEIKMKVSQNNNNCKTLKLPSLSDNLLESLINFDTQIHTCSRERFLKAFLKPEKVTTILALEHETIMGYGCVEKMHGAFYCIGPVYAKRYDAAHALFGSLITHVPDDEKVLYFAYENNKTMSELAQMCNAQVLNTYPCMVKGPKINVNLVDIYCILDANFGLA